MSPAKYPITPHPPCFTVGTTHAEIIHSPTLHLTKTRRLEPNNSNLDSSDQRTDFHQSNVHCSCFLVQASLFLSWVCFSSGFFATTCRLLWTVDVVMCLLLDLCEALIWAAISEAGNSNELIICSRGYSGSSFPVVVLMRASFIIALDGFCDCTWRNFLEKKVLEMFRIDYMIPYVLFHRFDVFTIILQCRK